MISHGQPPINLATKFSNIEDWERAQQTLAQQDPQNKYKRQNNDNSEQTPEHIATQETTEQTI